MTWHDDLLKTLAKLPDAEKRKKHLAEAASGSTSGWQAWMLDQAAELAEPGSPAPPRKLSADELIGAALHSAGPPPPEWAYELARKR